MQSNYPSGAKGALQKDNAKDQKKMPINTTDNAIYTQILTTYAHKSNDNLDSSLITSRQTIEKRQKSAKDGNI